MKIRMLLNNLDTLSGYITEVYSEPTKEDYCRILQCKQCDFLYEKWGERYYYLVLRKNLDDSPKEWLRVSIINETCAPEYLGSFLIGRYDKKQRRPMNLTDGDIKYIKKNGFRFFGAGEGEGRYILYL